MKFYLILFEIFSLVWIVSCKKNETTIPDNTICSTLLKLDTVWQVPLDTNFLLENENPLILNGQLINFSFSASDYSFNATLRELKTGKFIKNVKLPVIPDMEPIVYEGKLIFTVLDTPFGLRLNLFNPQTETSTYANFPYHVSHGINLIGDVLYGTSDDYPNRTSSIFSYNLKTKNSRLFNTVKYDTSINKYMSNYYDNIQPFIDKFGDTLIAYKTVVLSAKDVSSPQNYRTYRNFGVYNLSKNILNFVKSYDDNSSHEIQNLQTNENIYFGNSNISSTNYFCVEPKNGDTLWKNNFLSEGFSKVSNNQVFLFDYTSMKTCNSKSGFLLWANTEIPFSSQYDHLDLIDNLFFITSHSSAQNISTITIADINSGCIFRKIKTVSLKSNHTDFCLDKPNRLLYVFGSDYKLTCIKF